MKPINLAVQIVSQQNPDHPACFTCCFTAPDHISPLRAREVFDQEFVAAIEMGKITGHTAFLEVLHETLRATDEKLGSMSYIVPADIVMGYSF